MDVETGGGRSHAARDPEVDPDIVSIRGLRARGRHGAFAFEQVEGQIFVVDVDLFLDTAPAAESDDLADALDYGSVAANVLAVVEGEPVALIETLAQRIATVCLTDERLRRVRVRVHKPEAPIAAVFDDVVVTIVRERP